MNIEYSRDAIKYLEKQPKKAVERIRLAIAGLALSLPEGDIAPLKGYPDDRKRLRVGSWRIIYRCVKDKLLIIDIGNRGDIYK